MDKLSARLSRWWYLLTVGMWRGECSVDYTDRNGLYALASERRGGGNVVTGTIWWSRPDPQSDAEAKRG